MFGDAEPLSEVERAEIAALQASYDKVFCRRCDYCQPCSEQIPIQTVLGVRSMVKRMGAQLLREGMFASAIAKGRDCTECGDCMTRCPYDLPIPDLIRENLRWLDELPAGTTATVRFSAGGGVRRSRWWLEILGWLSWPRSCSSLCFLESTTPVHVSRGISVNPIPGPSCATTTTPLPRGATMPAWSTTRR